MTTVQQQTMRRPLIDAVRLQELVGEGLDDRAVASALGSTKVAVARARARLGIPSNFRYKPAAHGTCASYEAGCRCDDCRQANTARATDQRRKRREYPAEKIPHGLGGYLNYGCRCPVCRSTHAQALAQQRRRRHARPESAPHGTPSGFIDWGCRCPDCCRALSSKARRINRDSVRRAGRHGLQWTGAELEILCSRDDLTARALAALLGRSIYAVKKMQQRVRVEPLLHSIAGISEWARDGVV